MPPRADLLDALRAAEEHLSAVAPGPRLEARIRARLREQERSSRGPFGGGGVRRQRGLVLAFAVATAAVLAVFADRPRRDDRLNALASSPTAMSSVSADRIHTDGGPTDRSPDPRPARTPPRIHAPALDNAPRRPDGDPRTVAPPASAPSEPTDAPQLDLDRRAPAPPPHSGALTPRSARDRVDAPLSPVLSVAPPAKNAAPHVPLLPVPHDVSHEAPPPSAAPSPPPPPASSSSHEPSAACRSTDELTEMAMEACKLKGLGVAKLAYVGPCGGGRYRGVDAECADETEHPQDPKDCTNGEIGDGATCQDYATFPKEELAAMCAKAGLVLLGVDVSSEGCPENQWNKVAYQCCPSSPPAQSSTCTEEKVGDGATCQDPGAMKQSALDTCAADGLSLVDLALANDCPGGQSSVAKATCCAPSGK